MTVRAAVSKLLVEEHADVLREAVRVMLREVMEAEVSTAAGADSDERVAQRNGYRGREWDTRVGTIELAIPRLRTGSLRAPAPLRLPRRTEHQHRDGAARSRSPYFFNGDDGPLRRPALLACRPGKSAHTDPWGARQGHNAWLGRGRGRDGLNPRGGLDDRVCVVTRASLIERAQDATNPHGDERGAADGDHYQDDEDGPV